LPRVRRVPNPELRLSHENLTYDDLLRIVELIKNSEQFSEFRLKVGDIEIELRRHGAAGLPGQFPATVPPAPASAVAASAQALDSSSPSPAVGSVPPSDAPTWPAGSIVIRAPMIGTFYRAPEPAARPFVEIGQSVDVDTIVCIIEVMKLMNSISAEARGTVVQILVADAAPVETGQPLIVLRPEPSGP
jgi:acetyl-CoA carboxylase biotin carboxyl carrier protein